MDFARDDSQEAFRSPIASFAVWLAVLGAIFLIVGIALLIRVEIATLGSILFVGLAMIAVGVAQVVTAIQFRHRSHFWLWLLIGIAYALAGAFIVFNPVLTAEVLTLAIGISLVITALFKIILAIMFRDRDWLWLAVSGLITGLLGVLVLSNWPASSTFLIGMFLAIELIMTGFSLLWLARLIRKQGRRRLNPHFRN